MLTGKATAIAHGAATIVNAIALGTGAAFGVDLWTKAEVELTEEPYVFEAEITSDQKESTVLIEKTVFRGCGATNFFTTRKRAHHGESQMLSTGDILGDSQSSQ